MEIIKFTVFTVLLLLLIIYAISMLLFVITWNKNKVIDITDKWFEAILSIMEKANYQIQCFKEWIKQIIKYHKK